MNYRKAMFIDIDDISWSMGTEFFDNHTIDNIK